MLFRNLRRLQEDMESIAGVRMDAGETAMFARQLEHIYAQVYEIRYAQLKARRFFPVDTSVPSGAESFTYRMYNMFGAAAIIANYADDLPRVDVLGKEFSSLIKSLGASYGYSIQDIRRAAMAGAQLEVTKARAVRRAHEQSFDDIAAFGNAAAGLGGVTNNANVPLVTPDNNPWDTATSLQIIDDLNKLVNAIVTSTREIFIPDTVLLDDTSFEVVSTKPMSSTGDTDKTVLRYFLDNNPYINNVDRWNKLNDAGAGGVTRIMAYPRDPEVVQIVEPQPFEQFPPQWRNLEAVIPTHSRVGGVRIMYPLGMAYMDGTGE